MSRRRIVTRRFPDYGWAWPTGDLDLLLKAVLVADAEKALQDGLSWLATHNLDDVAFREQRLLAALSERFGRQLASSPAHPRLVGLQRLLWTRSRLALRDSAEALALLNAAGIPFMLLKGASRVALEPGAQRGRVSHDIDILLRRPDMGAAFAIVLDAGWQSAGGEGPRRLRERAPSYRAVNFLKGEFGDIDVHSLAYHPVHANEVDDEGLWARSVEASLSGIAARAPAPSDRIALAIAHGALDAHTHSDWLCDIDSCVRAGGVDWAALLETLRARRVLVSAASALTYLANEIGTPIPDDFMTRLVDEADALGLAARLALLESKPKSDFNVFTAAARGVVKQVRLRRGKRLFKAEPERIWRARVSRIGTEVSPGGSLTATLAVQRSVAPFEIVIAADLPPMRRRIDWELSSADKHLAVLRYRKLFSNSGHRLLSFKGEVELGEGDDMLTVSARPSRLIRNATKADDIARYGPVPFEIVRVSGGFAVAGERG